VKNWLVPEMVPPLSGVTMVAAVGVPDAAVYV
jgi:hypothetical protein